MMDLFEQDQAVKYIKAGIEHMKNLASVYSGEYSDHDGEKMILKEVDEMKWFLSSIGALS